MEEGEGWIVQLATWLPLVVRVMVVVLVSVVQGVANISTMMQKPSWRLDGTVRARHRHRLGTLHATPTSRAKKA